MEAVEFLRKKKRLCAEQIKKPGSCRECPLWYGKTGCIELQDEEPEKAVQIVEGWTAANPVEPGIKLRCMDSIFIQIYIEKGYLWAARDKDGELKLYRREPERKGDRFKSTSPIVTGHRKAMSHMLPAITWENSPVCLPKLITED